MQGAAFRCHSTSIPAWSLSGPPLANTTGTSALCPSGLVRYLHFPKAASSFFTTVLAYSCARVPFTTLELRVKASSQTTNISAIQEASHQGNCPCLSGSVFRTYHHSALQVGDVLNAAGLFRHPAERLVSAFNFGMHAHGLKRQAAMRSAVRNTSNRSEQLRTFARWPGVAHVQTKMLLGHSPSSTYTPTAADVELACSRVQSMKFVGVVSCFPESVALFKLQFPARHPDLPVHFRAGKSSGQHTSAARDLELLLAGGYRDAPDALVFCAAVSRLKALLRSHSNFHPSPDCLAAMQNGCTHA